MAVAKTPHGDGGDGGGGEGSRPHSIREGLQFISCTAAAAVRTHMGPCSRRRFRHHPELLLPVFARRKEGGPFFWVGEGGIFGCKKIPIECWRYKIMKYDLSPTFSIFWFNKQGCVVGSGAKSLGEP